MRDLGTLVRIDFLLAEAGDRLTEAARHLSASDREQARAILRNQQSALHQRLRGCMEAAYGIRPDNDGCIGTSSRRTNDWYRWKGLSIRRCRSAPT